jgi:hypothetical protein
MLRKKIERITTSVFLILLFLFPAISWCKTSTSTGQPRIITYHYDQQTFDPPDYKRSLKVGDLVSLKVVGINPIRRAVEIKINQTTFTELYQVPALISQNLLPQSDTQTNKDKAEKAKQSAPAGIASGAGSASRMIHFIDGIKKFNQDADRLQLFDRFAVKLRDIALLNERPQDVKANGVQAAGTFCQSPDVACAPNRDSLLAKRDELGNSLRVDFASLKEDFAVLKAQGVLNDDLTELFDNAQQRNKALEDSQEQREIQFRTSLKIFDADFGTVTSPPVQATGDQIDIILKAPLSTDAAKLETASQSGAENSSDPLLSLPVIGSLRPSFSTGIFFTGLTSPTFFKKADDMTAQVNEKDRFTTALGAMVHTPALYCAEHPDLSLHLSLGVALKDNNPIYVLGPSLIIGRRQRTVITAGLAGGQVDRLSGLKLGDKVTGDQPTTVKVFRTNFFFALTYNFGTATAPDEQK